MRVWVCASAFVCGVTESMGLYVRNVRACARTLVRFCVCFDIFCLSFYKPEPHLSWIPINRIARRWVLPRKSQRAARWRSAEPRQGTQNGRIDRVESCDRGDRASPAGKEQIADDTYWSNEFKMNGYSADHNVALFLYGKIVLACKLNDSSTLVYGQEKR